MCTGIVSSPTTIIKGLSATLLRFSPEGDIQWPELGITAPVIHCSRGIRPVESDKIMLLFEIALEVVPPITYSVSPL